MVRVEGKEEWRCICITYTFTYVIIYAWVCYEFLPYVNIHPTFKSEATLSIKKTPSQLLGWLCGADEARANKPLIGVCVCVCMMPVPSDDTQIDNTDLDKCFVLQIFVDRRTNGQPANRLAQPLCTTKCIFGSSKEERKLFMRTHQFSQSVLHGKCKSSFYAIMPRGKRVWCNKAPDHKIFWKLFQHEKFEEKWASWNHIFLKLKMGNSHWGYISDKHWIEPHSHTHLNVNLWIDRIYCVNKHDIVNWTDGFEYDKTFKTAHCTTGINTELNYIAYRVPVILNWRCVT